MPVTYTLRSDQCPTPIAMPSATLGQPATPFSTGQSYPPAGTSTIFNMVAQALALVCENGAGGYGILKGLDLSIDTGLKIAVSAGIAIGEGAIELLASSPAGGLPVKQYVTPASWTLADNATNYVWLTRVGALISSTSKIYPAQAVWFLGTVTTVAGAITQIDYSGRITLSGGRFTRQTADIDPPTDAPDTSLTLYTYTSAGMYLWNGHWHAPLPVPANKQTLSGTLSLSPYSATTHYLKTNGSNQNVSLPDLATIPFGRGYSFLNYDAAHNVVIKDFGGATLCTLTPGQSVQITALLNSSGTPIWPGTLTPATPAAVGIGPAFGI